MRNNWGQSILLAAAIAAVGALPVSAQSLADIAKKEAERREKLKKQGVASVVVTNESLDQYKGVAINDGAQSVGGSPGYVGGEYEGGGEDIGNPSVAPMEGFVTPPFEPEIADEPEGEEGRGGGSNPFREAARGGEETSSDETGGDIAESEAAGITDSE